MELLRVQFAVHVGVGKENLRGAAFLDNIKNSGLSQLVERLSGKHHRRILFAPGLEGFHDVILDRGVAQENPRFIDEKRLEDMGQLMVKKTLLLLHVCE